MENVIMLNERKNSWRGDIKLNIGLAKAVLYLLVESHEPIYKTKLNKLLFYAQFLYAKKYNLNLIGKRFIKDYYGPAIEDLDQELIILRQNNFIKIEHTNYGTIIYPLVKFRDDNYTYEERDVLQQVADKFRYYSAAAISERSHTEPLWINREYKQEIPLEEADRLQEAFI